MLNAFASLKCSKKCQHNVQKPSTIHSTKISGVRFEHFLGEGEGGFRSIPLKESFARSLAIAQWSGFR